MIFGNFGTDLPAFTALFKHMNETYLAGAQTSLADLQKIESKYVHQKELTILTDSIADKSKNINDKLLLLGNYFQSAGLKKEEIILARKEFHSGNIEGGVAASKEAIAYATTHAEELTSYMPDGFVEGLTTDVTEIATLNNEQNQKRISFRKFNADNQVYYDNVDRYITEICYNGKIVFKKDPVKRAQYTLTKIKALLNAEKSKKKEEEKKGENKK
ncbi:MAG TPA: hypothetical protein DDZ78_07710 [Porphyromonadaceae bacterium]|nr:hypothetical protein [Porphyromonadaceae bacterium]